MDPLELLLVHADDLNPVLDGLPPDAAAGGAKSDGLQIGSFRDDSEDPDSLPAQRWGVVAPEGPEGDRLLGLIRPLLLARQRQQDDHKVIEFRVQPGMSHKDTSHWKQRVYQAVDSIDEPRYLLILGDLHQVSLEFQQILAADCYMGRLAFDDDQGYESYVEKVLRWEREPPPDTAARSLFYTVRDGTAATTIGYRALMTPSKAECLARRDKGAFKASEIRELAYDDPSSIDALLAEAARPEPSMLFSMSHGLGAPRAGWKSVDEQRALQGAMSLGGGRRLTGEEMTSRPFLPGGAWFFLACYGAGTPAVSAYDLWLKRLKDAGMFSGRVEAVLASLPKPGDRPFVAALPKAVLANRDGPLSVIGHMDLAWTYSFQDMGEAARSRPDRFQDVFRTFVNGKRAGLAAHEILKFFVQACVDSSVLDSEAEAAAHRGQPLPDDNAHKLEKANLFMLRNDLSGYVLLGDPAARLPVSPKHYDAALSPGRHAPAPILVTASAPVVAEPAPATAPAAAPAHDPEEMEEAVRAVLRERDSKAEIAARYSVPQAELKRWVDAFVKAGRDALAKLG